MHILVILYLLLFMLWPYYGYYDCYGHNMHMSIPIMGSYYA